MRLFFARLLVMKIWVYGRSGTLNRKRLTYPDGSIRYAVAWKSFLSDDFYLSCFCSDQSDVSDNYNNMDRFNRDYHFKNKFYMPSVVLTLRYWWPVFRKWLMKDFNHG